MVKVLFFCDLLISLARVECNNDLNFFSVIKLNLADDHKTLNKNQTRYSVKKMTGDGTSWLNIELLLYSQWPSIGHVVVVKLGTRRL